MIDNLLNSDNFFFYGDNDLTQEISSDILLMLLQSKRTLLYSRSLHSAGVDDYENRPNTAMLNVLVPFDILQGVSKRNNVVGNGQNNTKERRIATSQNLVRIEQNDTDVDITLLYIPFDNLEARIQLNTNTGVLGGTV